MATSGNSGLKRSARNERLISLRS